MSVKPEESSLFYVGNREKKRIFLCWVNIECTKNSAKATCFVPVHWTSYAL